MNCEWDEFGVVFAAVWALDRLPQEDLNLRVIPRGVGHDAVHVKHTTPWRDRGPADAGLDAAAVEWKQVSYVILLWLKTRQQTVNGYDVTSNPLMPTVDTWLQL